ncbi:MAG: serine hydroxymethyltransferase, partial [Pseudomonadota bacterium]
KSLGGPAGGLIVSNDAALAARLAGSAFPGRTANFAAGRVAALARALLDWRVHGAAYAGAMAETASALANALAALQIAPYQAGGVATRSHQFAIPAAQWGGGQAMSKRLHRANLLACGIGLPIDPVEGDLNGLRIGTPEIVRLGMGPTDMPALADLIARVLREEPESVAADVTAFRSGFQGLHYVV